MKTVRLFAPIAAICAFSFAADAPQSTNLLWEYRNLGKAFYENPDTHVQAVEELKKALDLKPDSVRERINYGIALLRIGQAPAGESELLKAQQQDPTIPHTWFNLGIAYKRNAEYDRSIEQFRGMIKLVPTEPISHYNLAAVLRAQGKTQEAIPEFQEAERLNPNLAGPHFQLFTIYQRSGDRENAARERQLFEEAKKRGEGAAVPEDMEWSYYAELYDPPEPHQPEAEPVRYDDRSVSTGWDPKTSGLLLIDSNGDGHADLLAWSRERIALFKNGVDEAKNSGLEGIRDVRSVAAGDFDNDGLADLCIVTASGASIYHNEKGAFKKYADLPNTSGTTAALWLDYDHDYDLDILLFGANPVLMRNNGNGKFEDHTAAFPFVKGAALDAVTFAIRDDTAARDVAVSYADRPGVVYYDQLNGVFKAEDLPALAQGARWLDAQDFDHDGLIDLVSYSPAAAAIHNSAGKLEAAAGPTLAPSNIRADFNGDNREDYARILPDGTLHVYVNASPSGHWTRARIEGVKNIKTAVDATIEMKSGVYYEKRVYQGVPIPFALDGHADADTIRITWPNGLIQNEVHQKPEALKIAEAQRLSGSCPMIFTWNGREFEFITDVLGVAPLGASSGDGNYFPVDHNEYIQIPARSLQSQNGQYNVHITEELHEVSYLDKVQLIAVDHPEKIDIYTNEKFKSPPYPEFRLFGAKEKIHPIHAIEDGRLDAPEKVARIDHTYPDRFPHNHSGVAELHTLDLDFGQAARANKGALVLNGWVDWADGSTFLGQSQDGKGGLVFPYLQVKDASGKWQTVVQDMGIPSGKPKTIVVDLTGKFLSASREVRIVTNLCVYWDEIFLTEDASAPQVRLTPVDAASADLHFRGFSAHIIDPNRQQPERFFYSQVSELSNWNPTRGSYTRYGDVLPLVRKVDDKLIVMGSGDELKLQFPATALPSLPQGWTRDFILLVDGWAKDADPNTAFSQTVTPLPFHAMSAYPYKPSEHFPSDPEHQQYLRDYQTRPALRLIRPLATQGGD